MDEFRIALYHHPDPILNDQGVWETLLQRSTHNTVFMTPAWLKAAWLALDETVSVWIAVYYQQQTAVAAGAFVNRAGKVTFLGTDSADYLDILLDAQLPDEAALDCIQQLLTAVRQKIPNFKGFYLHHCLANDRTPARLSVLAPHYYAVTLNQQIAPAMTMDLAPDALRKKSLVRHEHHLQRLGQLTAHTFTTADEILARLDTLFEQHVRRWQNTPYPSLFTAPSARDLYRALTVQLAGRGWLRYTEISLESTVIACHFGFFYQTVFTWYKPAFEPALMPYSPGEVLIKYLIQDALLLNASVFDFTLGAEAFKFRFANQTNTVISTYVTDCFWRYVICAGKMRLLRWLRAPLFTPLHRCVKYLRSIGKSA